MFNTYAVNDGLGVGRRVHRSGTRRRQRHIALRVHVELHRVDDELLVRRQLMVTRLLAVRKTRLQLLQMTRLLLLLMLALLVQLLARMLELLLAHVVLLLLLMVLLLLVLLMLLQQMMWNTVIVGLLMMITGRTAVMVE